MEKKIQKKFIDHSLGFPVMLLNAPMVKVRGQWALHINYNEYQKAVLDVLAHKPSRLTGGEVQFIRKYFQMTFRSFAERFSVQHPAVIKWEGKGDSSTQMAWSTEKDVRLFVLDELQNKSAELRDLYRSLKHVAEEKVEPIVLDGKNLAA